MPWAAFPYGDERITALERQFKVAGYPTLVILSPTGAVVTSDGVQAVSMDEEGNDFPWNPPSLGELLGEKLVRNDGTEVAVSELQGKSLGLYFSAHW
jgi:nucleoredoxin